MSHPVESELEKAWLATKDRAALTNWRPPYIQRFIRQIGLDYDFLVTEHSAKFVSNERKDRSGMDRAVVTLEAEDLLIRFIRDRGDIEILVASGQDSTKWFPLEHLCVFLALEGNEHARGSFSQRVVLQPIPTILKENFSRLEEVLATGRLAETEKRLHEILELRTTGQIDVIHAQPDRSFLSNYASNSDAIGRVPFWKPLGIYTLTILALPLSILALILVWSASLFLKWRTSRRSKQHRLY